MGVFFVIKTIQTRLMKNLKSGSRIHLSFPITMLINLFYCWEKSVYPLNIGTIGQIYWSIIAWKRRFLQ